MLGLFVLSLGLPRSASAQEEVPLFFVNERTTVSDVSFEFRSTQTFEPSRLAEQVATEGPTFFDKVRRVLPLVNMAPHPFAPIELQRDVVRLRNFYQQNGFLQPEIGYGPTTLDTSSNTIDVTFAIEEGPPLIIQDVSFYGPDSTAYAVRQFSEAMRDRWIAVRDANPFRIGERYTAFNRTRIEDAVLRGLKNAGFAFAQVSSDVQVDSTAHTADLRFFVNAGPRARVSEIQVQGNESVSREVVLRELPFQTGDWYSASEVARGQRELFGLQLFRVALAEVPPQPRDSTVVVRYNVREASLRYISAEGGYARQLGVTAEGRWTHRNFFGDAREFSVGLIANTGFGARVGTDQVGPERLFRTSASLRQPYLFTTRLSGVASVFAEFGSNPQLDVTDTFLDTNAGQVGLSGTAIYEFMPYRTASLQYELSRALQFRVDTVGTTGPAPVPGGGTPTAERSRDIFNKSILTLNATLGRADDYVSPRRGFLIRPFLELGLNVPVQSGTEYIKAGGQITGYKPLTDHINLAGRIQGGTVWPYGRSGEVLSSTSASEKIFSTYENRFDPILFYAGGSSDVRGWPERLAGPKLARRVVYNPGTDNERVDYLYEAVGGQSKVVLSAELRMPFPGLGENWGTAAFLDAGQVWGAAGPLREAEKSFSFSDFLYGTGGGIRYRTPVGHLRLDLAFKVNPSFRDLRAPGSVFEYKRCRNQGNTNCEVHDTSFWRRMRLHLSIGQSF